VDAPFGAFRSECAAIIVDALREAGTPLSEEARLEVPSDPAYGDLSFSTFNVARANGLDPRSVAEGIVEHAKALHGKLIGRVEAAGGGYVNFYVNEPHFSQVTLAAISERGADYGKSGRCPESVIVEHTSVNPIHPIHIGGARNAVIGDCLCRILKAAGKDARSHFYIDDVGLQVAQASYGFGKIGGVVGGGKGDHFVGLVYAATSCAMNIKALRDEVKSLKAAGKDEEARDRIKELDDWVAAASDLRTRDGGVFDRLFEAISSVRNPEAEIAELLKRYEGRDPESVGLIRRLCNAALDGFRETLSRVGISFDSWDWESEVASWSGRAEEAIKALSATEYVRTEDGTLILDAEGVASRFGLKEKYGIRTEIPPLTLRRSDGTTLYTTRDLAYTLWKFERTNRVINVISIEQKLPQLQLKLALYAMGRGDLAERLTHFSYELVRLPEYRMSGRRGRYIAFDDVLNEAVERAYREVSEKSPHLGEEERRRISNLVGIGAVRYAMIAVASNKPITFTWDRVLNFEQNSAPFIQYAHARASNILVKAGSAGGPGSGRPDYSSLSSRYERDLILRLAVFPDAIQDAARTLRPEVIAEYANNLASKFNLFYDNMPVLKAEGGVRDARLRLVEATKTVLANALALMGIEAPSRM